MTGTSYDTHTAIRLGGFASVTLRPGQALTVHVRIGALGLATWNGRRMAVAPGRYVVRAGADALELRLAAGVALR